MLTEGGGILPGEGDTPDVWGVAFTEKTPCWVELSARGVPGHGAGASADAATHRLVAALARVSTMRFEPTVAPEVSQMFAALAPLAAPDDRAAYASLRGALALDPAFRARFLADPGRAALVRTTAAITTLSGGERTNVVPSEARAGIDARLLPGESCDEFVARLGSTIADPTVSLGIVLDFAADVSPTDTPLMDAIGRVAARSEPTGVVVPRVITGFTDAHWFRARGIVSYGFVPRRLRPRRRAASTARTSASRSRTSASASRRRSTCCASWMPSSPAEARQPRSLRRASSAAPPRSHASPGSGTCEKSSSPWITSGADRPDTGIARSRGIEKRTVPEATSS